MKKIHLICIGKTKDQNIQNNITLFEQRIRHFIAIQIDYCKDFTKIEDARKRFILETEAIKKVQIPQAFSIVCDINGKQSSSEQFAALIKQQLNEYQCLEFIIGGNDGISEELKQAANHRLSMSLMTFTHDMARLILLEQIYRGFTIINNQKYHH